MPKPLHNLFESLFNFQVTLSKSGNFHEPLYPGVGRASSPILCVFVIVDSPPVAGVNKEVV